MPHSSRRKEFSSTPSRAAATNMPPTTDTSTLSIKRRKSVTTIPGRTVVLPDDMILEVLPRLPVKSILRFQAVCRSWAALFSSKDFFSLHMATSKARTPAPKLLLVSHTSKLDTPKVYSCPLTGPGDDLLFTIDLTPGNSLEVVTPSTCSGLTLLRDADARVYYVCNAATRAITRLPHYSYTVSHSTAGLGFDNQTREYKVVRLTIGYIHEKRLIMYDVYTPGADYWRPAAGEVPFEVSKFAASAITHASRNNIQPVFANGFLHWLISPNFLGATPRAAIMLFSIAEETFGSVPAPPFWGPTEGQRPWPHASGEHLVVMDDQVCIVRDLCEGYPTVSGALEIWGLLDYGSGDWSMNHRIDLSGDIARELCKPYFLRVIGSVGNCTSGKKIVIAIREQSYVNYMSQENVYTYDPRCQVAQHIRCSTASLNHGSKFSLFQESLAAVHKSDKELALPSALAKATRETTTPN